MAKASGYYYDMDGFLHGKVGEEKKIILCLTTTLSKVEENGKIITYKIFTESGCPHFNFDDFLELSAVTFGESSSHRKDVSQSDLKKEALALAYTLLNYKRKRNHDERGGYSADVSKLCSDIHAYAKNKAPYKNFKKIFLSDPEKMNGSPMQYHIKAAIFAFLREYGMKEPLLEIDKHFDLNTQKKYNQYKTEINQDYSNGAIFWDGVDLKTNTRHPKVIQGYLVHKEHNVMNINSNKLDPPKKLPDGTYYKDENSKIVREHHPYSYMYETTAGYAKTTFVKLHDDYERAMRTSPWSSKENYYILYRWW